jgi:hypothetical protein
MKDGNITPKATGKLKHLFEKDRPTEDGKKGQELTAAAEAEGNKTETKVVDPKVKYIAVYNRMLKKHLQKFQEALDYGKEMSGMESSLPPEAIKEEAKAMAEIEFEKWYKEVLPMELPDPTDD